MARKTIKMTRSEPGSLNGFSTDIFRKNKIYIIDSWLAKIFVDKGSAEYISGRGKKISQVDSDMTKNKGQARKGNNITTPEDGKKKPKNQDNVKVTTPKGPRIRTPKDNAAPPLIG